MKKLNTLIIFAIICFNAVANIQNIKVTNDVAASFSETNSDVFTITVPSDANLMLGMKSSHFVDFTTLEPNSVTTQGEKKVYTYLLSYGQQYNYRTWKQDGVTNAGVFKMNSDPAKRPILNFTTDDYNTISPHFIDNNVNGNNNYNVADIFVNINERGHLKLNKGDTFDAIAYRSWEIIDGIITNYFVEPDFHYTILNPYGEKDNSVVTVEQGQPGSQWATLKAVGNGTAIVLVTYDAIVVNQYTDATKKNALGGQNWSAIWPENTAAYVVTVGQASTDIKPNMTINKGKNSTSQKLAGDNIDAECDVFYYPIGETGYKYTFFPEGVANVEIAYPTIGSQMATYNGFSSQGVTENPDGSYTILLKQGRQIVKLTDQYHNSEYQVLTAKELQYTINNLSNTESKDFSPGDKVAVKFNSIYHPANKLAGIHNFNATIEYTNIPETIIPEKANPVQYQFAANENAQTYTFTLPSNWDKSPLTLSGGGIRLGYYGDPIGNHRNTLRDMGRNQNFNASINTSFLSILPDITIQGNIPDAIENTQNITTSQETDYIYNLNGVRQQYPKPGINIIKKPDGKVLKILK